MIKYYDGHHETTEMNDASYSYIKYMDEERNSGLEFKNIIGSDQDYYFTIYSYYAEGEEKNVVADEKNLDIFFMRLMVYNPDDARWS